MPQVSLESVNPVLRGHILAAIVKHEVGEIWQQDNIGEFLGSFSHQHSLMARRKAISASASQLNELIKDGIKEASASTLNWNGKAQILRKLFTGSPVKARMGMLIAGLGLPKKSQALIKSRPDHMAMFYFDPFGFFEAVFDNNDGIAPIIETSSHLAEVIWAFEMGAEFPEYTGEKGKQKKSKQSEQSEKEGDEVEVENQEEFDDLFSEEDQPTPKSKPNSRSEKAKRLAKLLDELEGDDGIDESRVIELIKQHSLSRKQIVELAKGSTLQQEAVIELIKEHSPSIQIELKRGDESRTLPKGIRHRAFEDLVKIADARLNVMMVGPAGSGKTTLASQVADALGLEFHMTGAILQKFEITGFMDATGKYVPSTFFKAFTEGGLFLWDEIDGSNPQALVPFNAALENDRADFPCGTVERHKDFVAIAAANTYGSGADRQYVGRNQLDAATLDRFVVMDIDYDTRLEEALCPIEYIDWCKYVQNVRNAIQTLRIRHIVSPRATIRGASLLAMDIPRSRVEEMVIWKGLDEAQRKKIQEKL